MSVIKAEEILGSYKLSIINFFILLALLRMTNFNFYLSKFFGLPVEINALGGGAFNFINYFATAALVIVLLSKICSIASQWVSLLPFAILILLYVINNLLAPYSNDVWLIYQLVFICIAATLHIYTRKVASDFSTRFRKSIDVIFGFLMLFVIFCTSQILLQYSPVYYLSEFNDSFVHSLDDFGVMKQCYGYLLGFLLSYTLFIRQNWVLKLLLLCIIVLAGFGIRSFIIGVIGSSLIFTFKKPQYLFGLLLIIALSMYFFIGQYFENIIFDTRFYSYFNAFDIVQTFPFGVGLGGYPEYTEEFSRQLFADFYNINSILDYIPSAPESDYVHLFGSLGLGLGLVHLFIQLRIIWFSFRLQDMCQPFEKCILFYFCFMTFFGFGEDSMFTVYYWIFFGIASGIISSLLYRKRLN